MKTATRLRFSQIARTARVGLLIALVALLAVLIVDLFPHRDVAPPDTHRTTPTERTPHYQFPTYA
jgi:hypothetical protein